MEDTSYIIKTKIGDKYFIINRNKSLIDSEVKPNKSAGWWELDDKKFRATVLGDIEILEEVPYDNQEHRHQKILNSIKKGWREKLGVEVETTPISDETICEIVRENKLKITQAYIKYENKYHLIRDCGSSEIKRIAIDLLINKYHLKFNGVERWRIVKDKRSEFPSEGHMLFYLFQRDELMGMGKRCYGLWKNNPGEWDSLEDCVKDVIASRYMWDGWKFIKYRMESSPEIIQLTKSQVVDMICDELDEIFVESYPYYLKDREGIRKIRRLIFDVEMSRHKEQPGYCRIDWNFLFNNYYIQAIDWSRENHDLSVWYSGSEDGDSEACEEINIDNFVKDNYDSLLIKYSK